MLGQDEPVTRTPRRTVAAALVALTAALVVTGCQGDSADSEAGSSTSGDTASASPSETAGATASASPSPTPARAVPAPRNRACYDYRYPAAIAPVTHGHPVPCAKQHTAITYSVGQLDTVVDGHLVSVDSDRVRAQIGRASCRERV